LVSLMAPSRNNFADFSSPMWLKFTPTQFGRSFLFTAAR
jgi:hypothetical protein